MPDIMVLMPPKTTYDESEKRAQFFSLCVSVALNVAAAGAAVAPAMAVGGLRCGQVGKVRVEIRVTVRVSVLYNTTRYDTNLH